MPLAKYWNLNMLNANYDFEDSLLKCNADISLWHLTVDVDVTTGFRLYAMDAWLKGSYVFGRFVYIALLFQTFFFYIFIYCF